MLLHFVRRLVLTIPTLIALMFLTFIAIRLVPGDPVEVRTGEHGISPERLAEFRHQLGLDQPVWMQFLSYVNGLLHGDFGTSIRSQGSVLGEFLQLYPATIELSLFAIVLAVCIGIPLGVLAAVKRGTIWDYCVMALSMTGYSMPIFWWALLLILVFSVQLDWLPVSGRLDLLYYFEPTTGFMTIDSLLSDQVGAFSSALAHLVLPSIVLGTVPLGAIARMTRSSMLEVLSEDYLRTARAKGLSPFRVIGIHGLRNALIPVITMIALQLGTLLGGAVLTETIFSWPGIGKWLIEAIGRRDYPVLQGGTLLVSGLLVIINLVVDLLNAAVDPRVRHGR